MGRDEAAEGRDDEDTPTPGAADAERSEDDAADLPRRENVHAVTVVGLGGSAGSIPALEAFFQGLPDFQGMPGGSGPAYVVVLHLAPDHESRLAELLARSTSLPVSQVTGTVHIQADQVYVIPPGKNLEMRDGTLSLHDLETTSGTRTAIDTFFRTLADAHGPQATAVVLSGTGADGTLGLRRIKEVGGLTVAQSPAEAEYDAMPRNAIATGQVDYVLPAAAMARQIAAYWETSRRMRLPAEAAPSPEQRLEGPEPEAALRDILAHVRAQTGHDFGVYKRATILRRIGRRLQVNGQESLPAYLDFLRRHPAETGDLVGDLLISVTQFFRDPETWRALERDVVPRLFLEQGRPDQDSPGEPVRVWVCGCATGEEAYTLAILLLEHAARTDSPARLQVFATDMDADAITTAREGVYPDTIAVDVSEERLRRWFYRTEGGRYQVRKEVRETVLFASHDVLRDTPFSRMSLVTCRNLLIYLTGEAQQRCFETFHFALRPEGRLFLGTSESVEAASFLFGATDKAHRLFVRRPVARPILPAFTRSSGPPAVVSTLPSLALSSLTIPEWPRSVPTPLPPETPPAPRPVAGAGELHQSLLELYAPPSALVDERHEVLHLSDGAGRFLRVGGGEPTRDLLRMVLPELRVELRTALFMAASEGRDQVRLARATLAEGRPPAPVRLTVRSVDAPEGARGYLLVFFQELSAEAAPADSPLPALTAEGPAGSLTVGDSAADAGPPNIPDLSAVPVVRQLEEENAHLQAQVRATVERYEALTEELKASNEELQAINEELRSAAEELETSKEELQSLNEELTTVNHELKSRVDEVSRANGDLQNFLASTDIGTIFLDRALLIRRYTPAAETLFQLIPSDVGRPLSDLTTRLDYPELWKDAARVLDRLETGEREVATANGWRHFLARLLPYRTLDDRIDGVVVNFVDITERKRAEEAVRENEAQQSYLVKLSDAIRPLGDPNEIQAVASRILGEQLGVDRAYYVEIDEADRQFSVAHDWHQPGVLSHARRYPLEDWPTPWLANGEVWVIRDTDSDPAMPNDQRASYRDNGIRAAIVVPLIKAGRLAATFAVNQNAPRQWTAVEVALVRETAERTWAAVERARAEKDLARSEEKYRTLFDSIDEGVATFEVLFDDGDKAVDYRFLEINSAHEVLSGVGHDVVGKRIREVMPSIEESVIERVGRVALTGEPIRFEDHVSALGRWFDVYLSRVGGEDSRTVATVFSNITERKNREANLAFLAKINLGMAPLLTVHEVMDQVGEQLAGYLQLSRCHFSVVDEENDRVEVIYEYRRDEELPSMMGVHRISDGITEEGLRHYRAGKPAVINASADSPLVKTPAHILKQFGLGSLVDVPHLEGGRWRFLLTLGRAEVGEWRSDEVELLQELASKVYIRIERARAEGALRNSEEKYRTLFDSMDEGFAIEELFYDGDGSIEDIVIREVNRAYERQSGLTDVIGRSVFEVSPNLEQHWKNAYEQVAKTGEPLRLINYSQDLNRWFDVSLTTFADSAKYLAVLFTDITERKHREANLAFLAEVSEDLVRLTNIDETMDVLSRKVGEHFNVSRVNFAEINDAAETAVVTRDWHVEGLADIAGERVPRLGDFISDEFFQAARAGEMMVVRDTRTDARTDHAVYAPHAVRSFVAMPFLRDGQWQSLMSISASEPRDWREDEIELMRELTMRVWTRLEHARAEEALRESEGRLQRMMNVPQVGVLTFDFSGALVAVNDAFLAMVAYSRDEFEARSFVWQDFTPPEYMEESRQQFERMRQTGMAGPYEKEYFRKDGSRVWLMFVAADLGDGTMVEYAIDISGRKRAEEAVRESEAQYRTLFTSIDEGFCTLEVLFDEAGDRAIDYRFLETNPAFERQTGLENAAGRTMRELAPAHEDFWFKTYGRVARTGEAVRFEHEAAVLGKFYDVYAFRIGEPGQNRLAVIFNDIYARRRVEQDLRESEQRFRLFVTAASDILYRMSADWSEMRTLQGKGFLADTRDSKRTWLDEYIPDSDREVTRAAIAEATRAKTTFALEHRVIRADGTIGWASSRAIPLLDERGEIVEWFGAASDITERRRAEEALRESEERARALIANLPGGAAFVVNREERYVLAEGEALTAAGFVPADFLGKTLDEALPPELRAPYREAYNRAFAGETFEEEHFSHGRWFLTRGVPLRDDDGVTGALAVSYEITTRRRIEEALRASEERFRTLADAVPQVIWTNTADGTADYFNRRWYEYTGLNYEESAGPGWQAIVHPGDAPASVKRWQRSLATGAVFDTEYRLRRYDGAYCWFLGRNVPLKDDQGRVTGWFGTATDIDDLKQAEAALRESEERFRLLVEGARDYAMFLLDPDGHVTFWSAGAERVLGYTEAEALGQPSALIFTPEDREQGDPEREIEQARAGGRAADRRWHVRRDGSLFWADGMLMRLDDESGGLRGFAKVMRDATEQWRAEEEARRAMAAVGQANAELEGRVEERTAQWREAAAARQDLTRRLVGAEEEERRRLSRELHDQTGQHLTGLMLGLDALRASQPAGGEPAALAERLRQAAADLSREVHQLAWDLRPPALDDIGLAQTLLSYVQEWGQRQGVAADFFAPDWDGERLAPAVETALYRVVQEALTNVARHARAGRVSIVLERRDGGAVLVIEDDGAGFDATATLASPARLGLRGMRERVEMVGGTLEIESSHGGTTLVVNVPAATEGTETGELTAEENTEENTDAPESA